MELWFILKVKHTAFSDGLDVGCEKKTGNQEWQQGCSGLSNWKDGVSSAALRRPVRGVHRRGGECWTCYV